MVNRMRNSRGRRRTGSDAEISVKREKPKGKLEKKQSSSRFVPANGQAGSHNGRKSSNNSDREPSIKTKKQSSTPSSTIRRETVPRGNAAPKQTGSKTRPPVRPPVTMRRSPSKIPLQRTPSKLGLRRTSSKLFQKKSTSKSPRSRSATRDLPPAPPPPMPPPPPRQPVVVRRSPVHQPQQQQYYGSKRSSSRSERSVGSIKSFKKSLGFRPPRRVPRKIAPRIADDWTFFTFNTLPGYQRRQLLDETNKSGESPGFSAIVQSLFEDCSALGSHLSLCLIGDCGGIAGALAAIGNAVSSSMEIPKTKRDSPGIDTVDTMDDYIARTKEKDEAFAKTLNEESREPPQSVYHDTHDESTNMSPRNAIHLPPSIAQETRYSNYCVEATMKPLIQKSVLQEDDKVVASRAPDSPDSRAPSINYSWENLDDESLVERSVVPQTPPNKVMIGRKLIDYDDVTIAYNQAEQSRSELDDPGCECFEGCFKFDDEYDDEYEDHGDERTLQMYTGPSYTDHSRQQYDHIENPSTVMEVDEVTQGPSVGATTFDETYVSDARDEQSLESEGRFKWRF